MIVDCADTVFESRGLTGCSLLQAGQDDEKRLNVTYIISVVRKLGCSIFLLPDDIME
ncbi:hypothetical protein Droror1_Dr00017772, partial [Drosera rotundifolia]